MKYNAEKKEAAIARMAEIGVQKTSEEMNISIQTLYKWRNEGKDVSVDVESVQQNAGVEGLLQVIHGEERQTAAIKRLEEENSNLSLKWVTIH